MSLVCSQHISLLWLIDMSSFSKADRSSMDSILQDYSAQKKPLQGILHHDLVTKTETPIVNTDLLPLNHCSFYPLRGRVLKGAKVRSFSSLYEGKIQASCQLGTQV